MSENRRIQDRYEIEDRIGSGGMGAVYRGTDTLTGDTVAIKQLKPEVLTMDPGIVERFDREGEMLRRLNHPNIVKVLATVEEDGSHYIVMDYIDGGSLRDLLDDTPRLDVDRVLEIALDLSDALTRAHRLKIIHRDIKPANVLINEHDLPLLTDFGVARMNDTTRMTATGALVGTLAYLPPESLGDGGIDARADIWAFGVMLYEMLAGRRPFAADNTGALLTAIISQPVPDIFEFRDDLPWTLIGLVYWMLEKDPDKRPASARLVGAMLENIMSGAELPLNWFDESQPYTPGETPVPPPEKAADVVRQYTTGSLRPEDYLEDLNAARQTAAVDTQWQAEEPITRSDWSVHTRRQVEQAPRIHIIYRSADSQDITERIFERMVLSFGEAFVVKDMVIPPGVDFETAIKNAINASDVLLVIIGKDILTTASEGKQLNDPGDYMRIAIATGLQNSGTLTIPVLVHGASMPSTDRLASDIQGITRLNTARVRDDPDFNRDVEWLVNQIFNNFEVLRPSGRRGLWAGAAALLLMLAVLVGGLLLVSGALSGSTSIATTPLPESPEPAADEIVIEPVEDGRYMALVAQAEQLPGTTTERDVQRFVLRDLRDVLEEDFAFADIRIRAYPAVIQDEDEAREIAEQVGASVVVWGNYNDDRVELTVQTGSLAAFPDVAFPREDLETVTDVTLTLTDETQESVVASVVSVIGMAHYASADMYDNIEALVIVNDLTAAGHTLATVTGNNAAAQVHRAVQIWLSDQQEVIALLDTALERNSNNALLYGMRAVPYLKLADYDRARQDLLSADRLASDDWDYPVWLEPYLKIAERDLPAAISGYEDVVARRPDDWMAHYLLGILHYMAGDYESSLDMLQQSIALQPDTNFPYAFAAPLVLREGDLATAQDYYETVLREFPDPTFGERVIYALNGDNNTFFPVDPGAVIGAFGNLVLGQYEAVLDNLSGAVSDEFDSPDLHLVEGFAHCNLDQPESAEAAYDRALAMDPGYTLANVLRAEVRQQQGDLMGALEDVAAVTQSPESAVFMPLVQAAQSGDLSCRTFFVQDVSDLTVAVEPDDSLITTDEPPTTTPPDTDPDSITIAPVEPGEVMILVADLQQRGETDREVTTNILADLRRTFEEDIPFSNFRVRSYPDVIPSADDAVRIAQETGANIVVRGEYDDNLIEVTLHTGDLPDDLLFDRDTITEVTDVTLRLSDARLESLSFSIIAIMNALYGYDVGGGGFEVGRNLLVLEELTTQPAEPVGSSISARYHRYIASYVRDPETALREINGAVNLDATNPFLYLTRSLIQVRLGYTEASRDDIITAMEFGPDNWTLPLYQQINDAFLIQNDLQQTRVILDQVLALETDDWWLFTMSGAVHYLSGEYESAREHLDRALSLDPQANFAHAFSIGLALREGRLLDAQRLSQEVLEQFPDPAFGTRLMRTVYGETTSGNPFVVFMQAFGNINLRQWRAAITYAQTSLERGLSIGDVYFMQGFAYCNLEDHEAAETAYTAGLEIDPDFALLYLLRAEARRSQGNLPGALQDTLAIADTPYADTLAPYLDPIINGQFTCQNFFDIDLEAITQPVP